MAKKPCTTLAELQREIMKRANKGLEKDVAPYVKNKLKEHVERDVYSTYNPKMYERREDDGGLVDDKNINHELRKQNRTLYVYEEAPIEGPRLDAPDWVNRDDSLARLIEHGAHNPWNHRRYRWTKPREFMDKTQQEINDHPKEILELLKNRIEHDNPSK